MELLMECLWRKKPCPYPPRSPPEALRVRGALTERGRETPLIPTGLSRGEKHQRIAAAFTDITRTPGLDLWDDSLCETPHRVAKMYVDEIFSGLDYSQFPKISVIENKMKVEDRDRPGNPGCYSLSDQAIY